MNLQITIPDNWNPNDKNGFNKWINKVYKHAKKSKL
jgi:hypothetical protein